MDWSVQFLSTVYVPQDERSPGSSPARHSEVLANEIATSRAVRWSTYKARSRCHACFEPDHRPGGEDRPYRLGSRLRRCLDGGHAQRSRVLRLRRGSGEFRSGRYSADVGCQAAARSPSDWFGWFRQNGGLALRPKADAWEADTLPAELLPLGAERLIPDRASSAVGQAPDRRYDSLRRVPKASHYHPIVAGGPRLLKWPTWSPGRIGQVGLGRPVLGDYRRPAAVSYCR